LGRKEIGSGMGLASRLDERPLGWTQIRIVALMMLLLMVEGLDLQLLGLLTPILLEEWQVTRAAFGPAMSAALIGLAIGSGFGGRLGDRFGRKPVLMVSAAIFGIGTVAAAATGNVAEMTIVRFLSGLGFGAASPVTIALVAEWMPRRLQPAAIALMTVGVPLGGMIGALALIALIPLIGWRGCFMACGAVTMLISLLVLFGLRESPVHLAARGRKAEALELLRRHVDPAMAEADLARDAAPNGAQRERVFGRALLRLNLGGWLLLFAGQFIAYSMISWSTTFLTLAGFSMDQALHGNFILNVCAVAATLAAGALAAWLGSRRLIVLSALLAALSLMALLGVLASLDGPASGAAYWSALAAIAGIGLFASMGLATAYMVMTLGYPENIRATGLGITLMIGRMGGMLTGLLGGWLLSLVGDATWPLLLLLVLLALAMLVAGLVIDRHIGGRATRAPASP
jgi:MFS transporter, AAHS family, 4-hydroxybenzoate transporter